MVYYVDFALYVYQHFRHRRFQGKRVLCFLFHPIPRPLSLKTNHVECILQCTTIHTCTYHFYNNIVFLQTFKRYCSSWTGMKIEMITPRNSPLSIFPNQIYQLPSIGETSTAHHILPTCSISIFPNTADPVGRTEQCQPSRTVSKSLVAA